jgi:hypothetical protein
VNGAGAVVALVLVEWTAGWIATAAWSQSWGVIRRGHFRITAWITLVLAVLALLANGEAVEEVAAPGAQPGFVVALAAGSLLYLAVQYSRTDVPAVVAGAVTGTIGVVALLLAAELVSNWPWWLAVLELVSGMLLLGAVWNGMMLGHWYLNQPGLNPRALGRLTDLGLVGVAASGVLGLVAAGELTNASTEGAVLGVPGFGESFSLAFYLVWIGLMGLTGAVVWAARRCVAIRSIQSATGLLYVAVLSAGVSEFLVRYLMVNAT